MNLTSNIQINLITTTTLPLHGNSYIYNLLLDSIDTNVEIPPSVGKGSIMDLVCKIFSNTKYEVEKNKITQIIINIDKKKGTTIIKLINLIKNFRPENETFINSNYTILSNALELSPKNYLDNLLNSISGLQEKITNTLNKINPLEILKLIKEIIIKKSDIKIKKNKKIVKNS